MMRWHLTVPAAILLAGRLIGLEERRRGSGYGPHQASPAMATISAAHPSTPAVMVTGRKNRMLAGRAQSGTARPPAWGIDVAEQGEEGQEEEAGQRRRLGRGRVGVQLLPSCVDVFEQLQPYCWPLCLTGLTERQSDSPCAPYTFFPRESRQLHTHPFLPRRYRMKGREKSMTGGIRIHAQRLTLLPKRKDVRSRNGETKQGVEVTTDIALMRGYCQKWA